MTDSPPLTPPRATLLFLLANAFLFTMGIGLVLPVMPYIVGKFVSDPRALSSVVTLLAVSYSLCAFFAAPFFGAMSDRFGRRPVLLVSLLGSSVGYLVFGWAGALPMLFLGRVIDGLSAGNFSALFGMLADITAPEQRGKFFGQVGAVAGGGFILGPAIGGLASRISLETPLFLAAGLCLLNLLWGLLFVPETHPQGRRSVAIPLHQLNPFTQILELLSVPHIRRLILSSTLFVLPFAMMQTLLSVLLKTSLNWGPDQHSLYRGRSLGYSGAGLIAWLAYQKFGRVGGGSPGSRLC